MPTSTTDTPAKATPTAARTRSIFVLNGHPAGGSLNALLSDTYAQAARAAGHEVTLLHLHDLAFDPDYEQAGYSNVKPLEEDLETVKAAIEWADHIVLFAPMWWGGLPAKLKGLFDRVLLPGTAFDTRNTNFMGMPSPMLTGRKGRIVITADTPLWFERLRYRSAIIRQVRDQIFSFVGITPTKITWLAGATDADEKTVQKWRRQVESLGKDAA